PRDVKAHLTDKFLAVRDHALTRARLVAIQHNIGHDYRLAATGRQHGKHVAVTSVPTVIHGLFELGLVGAEDYRRHNTTICQCPTLAGPTNEQPYQAGLCAIAPPWHTTT